MAYIPITYVDITPATTDAWVDVDVSAYVSSNAKGVSIYAKSNNTSVGMAFGLRKNGSTDDRTTILPTTGATNKAHTMGYIGLDEDKIFEVYLGASATYKITLVLVGEFGNESEWFTNAYDKSLSSTATVVDIDISSETNTDTATGGVFEIDVIGGISDFFDFFLRENGSTDDFYFGTSSHFSFGFICPVDASEICEGKIENTNTNFYLVGYIKHSVLFYTNAVDISLSATTTWTDITLPNSNIGAIIEVVGNNSGWDVFGFRKNGYTDTLLALFGNRSHSMFISDTDSSKKFEGYIGDTSTDFYLRGEFGNFISGTGIWINVDDEWLEIISSATLDGAYVNTDGTVPLTADWDAGGYEIRALTFESDVATGTAPLTIASTTVVTNLNADLLDGSEGSAFALLAGRAGGQVLYGGTGSGDDLTLHSTSHATKGTIFFGANSGYDQVNDRLGIGVTAPTQKFQVREGNAEISTATGTYGFLIASDTISHNFTGIGGVYANVNTNTGGFLGISSTTAGGVVVGGFRDNNGSSFVLDATANTTGFTSTGIILAAWQSNGSTGRTAITGGKIAEFKVGNTGTMFSVDYQGNLIIGEADAVDKTITIRGDTNNGIITWMEDEDYFKFSDDILMDSTERVYFRDTALYISSIDDGHLDLTADTSIDMNANIDIADAKNIILGTTTGTKIGTSASQKIGFYNATPVVQRAKASYNNWASLSDVVNALVALGLFDTA